MPLLLQLHLQQNLFQTCHNSIPTISLQTLLNILLHTSIISNLSIISAFLPSTISSSPGPHCIAFRWNDPGFAPGHTECSVLRLTQVRALHWHVDPWFLWTPGPISKLSPRMFQIQGPRGHYVIANPCHFVPVIGLITIITHFCWTST